MKNSAARSGVSFTCASAQARCNGKSFMRALPPSPLLPFITAASGQRAAGVLAAKLRPKPYSGFFRINERATHPMRCIARFVLPKTGENCCLAIWGQIFFGGRVILNFQIGRLYITYHFRELCIHIHYSGGGYGARDFVILGPEAGHQDRT
jgi:hypothetical protein